MNKLEKFYKLHKKLSNNSINSIKIGGKNNIYVYIHNRLTDTTKKQKEELERNIANFLKLMMFCPGFSIERFKEKFASLKINFNRSEDSFSCYSVTSSKDNELNLSDNMSIEHELLHFSSDKMNDKTINIGFWYNDGMQKLGFGINEGYTEYLNEKYFEHHIPGYYDYFMHICEKISELFGEEIINIIYFNGSIHDLIKIIAKKSSLEMATKFIIDMDDAIYSYYDFIKSGDKEKYQNYFEKITSAYRFINHLGQNKIIDSSSEITDSNDNKKI